MDCICQHMQKHGMDMHVITYKSVDYKNFYLYECYGTWYLRFNRYNDDVYDSIEIFHCPFCGRKLNNWHWAEDRFTRIMEQLRCDYEGEADG